MKRIYKNDDRIHVKVVISPNVCKMDYSAILNLNTFPLSLELSNFQGRVMGEIITPLEKHRHVELELFIWSNLLFPTSKTRFEDIS